MTRAPRRCRWRGVIVLFLFALTRLTAAAADSHLSSDPRIDEVRALLNEGKHQAALSLLRALPDDFPDQTDLRFLTALAAMGIAGKGEADEEETAQLLDEAIAALRAILVAHPGAVRVRLELARAFFLKEEDDLARRHFELVLAGNPPRPIVFNINRFLAVMESRRKWRGYFNTSFLPEARVERNSTIRVAGLPFQQPEGEKSGIGINFTTGGTYTQQLGEQWRMVYGVNLSRNEYRTADFDSTRLKFHLGPEYTLSAATTFHLSLASERDISHGEDHEINDVYSLDAGVRHRFTNRFSLTGDVYITRDRRGNGPNTSYSLNLRYLLSPTAAVNLGGVLSRSRAKDRREQGGGYEVSLGADTILPAGFTAGGRAAFRHNDYDSSFLVLGAGERWRKVRTFQFWLGNRALTFWGFSPRVALVRQLSDTNYQLDIYQSTTWQLNFLRQF